MLADPAKLIVDLLEKTDPKDPQSLLNFAKELQALELFGPKYIGPYLREKGNIPPEKEVTVGGDDILPFYTGALVGYLAELDPATRTRIADKAQKICDNIYTNFSDPRKQYSPEEEEHRAQWCNDATQISVTFTYLKNNGFTIPDDDEDMKAAHEYSERQRTKAQVQELERALDDYKVEMIGCAAIAKAEVARQMTTALPTHSERKSITSGYGHQRRAPFVEFHVQMTALSEEIENLKKQKPKMEDYQGKPDSYHQALNAYKEKLTQKLQEIPEKSLKHAEALEKDPMIKSLHIKEPSNIKNRLHNACASVFKRLHEKLPKLFTQETPDFLKSKTQRQVGLIKKNLQK